MEKLIELRENIKKDILIAMDGHEEVFDPTELCDIVISRFGEYFKHIRRNKMDITEKNNIDPMKKGKIGMWLTPNEVRIIQNALVAWSTKLKEENDKIAKLGDELNEISLSFDNQQEDDNGQGSNAAQEQDR